MVESTTTPTSPISSPGPSDVVASFLRLTIDTPDLKKAKLHLSKRSLDSGMMDAAAVPAGSTYTLGAQEADELGARIPVSVKSPVPGSASLQEMTVPVVVVHEEGEWKIDLPATMERLLGGASEAIGQAVGEMGKVLSDAMTGMGNAFAEGMAAVSAPSKPKAAKPAKKTPKKAAKKSAKKAPAKPAKKSPKKIAKKKPTKPARKSAKPKPKSKPAKKKRR